MKRTFALILALVLALSVFAGCGAKKDSAETPADTPADVQDNQDVTADPFAEEVNLIYVIPTIFDDMDMTAITEEVNKITKEKINATVTFELIPLAEYTDKMNMKFMSGEEFDICFTGAWNPYGTAVSKGAYAELTEDMLNTYCPGLMAQLNPAAWDAVRINGKIYGCPIEQIYVRDTGLLVEIEAAEAAGFDIQSVKELEDIEPLLVWTKENAPEKTAFVNDLSLTYNMLGAFDWDVLGDWTLPGAAYAHSDSTEIFNQFETEEFMEFCKLMREWYEAGYIPADAVVRDSEAASSDPVAHIQMTKPGWATSVSALGRPLDQVTFGYANLTTASINATVSAISANSKNVERSLALIDLLNTDKELLNLVCHGIEGVDWNFIDEENGVIEKVNSNFIYSFFVGCVFNEYYTDPAMVGTIEDTIALNANAGASPLLGFVFDSDPVSTEIARCMAVTAEHLPALVTGTIDPETGIPAMLEALDAADVDVVIAEMQNQVNAWLATK